MKNVMTKENIESILISAIINKIDNYESLTRDISYEFFKSKSLRLTFEYLKGDKYKDSTKNVEEFLFKIFCRRNKIFFY